TARRDRAHGGRGEVVELLPPLLPRLAPTRRPATRTAERARRTAAAAAATATPGGTAPVATGRAHARAAGTTTETTAGPRTAATAATTGRRTARGATPTRDAGRPGRPLARHGRGRRPGRHRGRRRPGRHRRRRRPGAGRGDAVRVVDTATHRRARGLPAVGRRLLPALGLPGGLHRRLLLSLERGGPGLGGRHLDVVCAGRLRHARGWPRHRSLRRLLRHRARLTGHAGRGGLHGRSGLRRLGRLRLRRLLRRRAGGHLLPQPPGHGRLDGARRGLDELAHLLELGEHGLALNAELLRELMYAGFACHCTPQSEAARGTPAA